jgi:DNA-binding protein HU-beta
MKKDIVAHMRENAGMTVDQADAALTAVVAAVKDVAARSTGARIPGLGTFKVKTRAERTARNPKTGETVRVAAREALTFKEAKGG